MSIRLVSHGCPQYALAIGRIVSPPPDENHQMLTVTHAARALLSEMMAELQPIQGKVVRIITSGTGLSLELGEIQADDRVFNHDAKLILAIADDVIRSSERLLLDAVATGRGLDLRVTTDHMPSQLGYWSVASTQSERKCRQAHVPHDSSS